MDQIKESCVYITSSLLRKANRQIDTGNKKRFKIKFQPDGILEKQDHN